MIECFCINDKDRPNDVPLSKWVKEGDTYNIIYATVVLPQNILAFQLQEIDLDDKCFPYQYFSSERFVISENDISKLHKLVMDSAEANSVFNQIAVQISTAS